VVTINLSNWSEATVDMHMQSGEAVYYHEYKRLVVTLLSASLYNTGIDALCE
jgi:hypothetical protein